VLAAVIYLTLVRPFVASVSASGLIYDHPRHRLAIFLLLRSVNTVRALVHGQTVDFMLNGKVFQFAEMVRIILLEHRNRPAIAGHVDSLEPGIVFDYVTTVGCLRGCIGICLLAA
jgi:hypothetical protein